MDESVVWWKLLERSDLELKFYASQGLCALALVGQHTTPPPEAAVRPHVLRGVRKGCSSCDIASVPGWMQDGSIGSVPKGRTRMPRMDAKTQGKHQRP
jgi:hypothetical protein